MSKLRVEEAPPKAEGLVLATQDGLTPAGVAAKKYLTATKNYADLTDVDHWRRMARDTAERLSYAEAQARDLRTAADEARARFSKYKGRLDAANEKINDLQVQLVRVTADRDQLRSEQTGKVAELRAQLARQNELAARINEYRRSLLEGPLWDLFVELSVSPPKVGGEQE